MTPVMIANTPTNLETVLTLIHKLGPSFAQRAAQHDQAGSFVTETFEALKEYGLFTAAIPTELGGAGLSHSEMCEVLRTLAQYCPSSALTLSMHQHLIAANVYKYRPGYQYPLSAGRSQQSSHHRTTSRGRYDSPNK